MSTVSIPVSAIRKELDLIDRMVNEDILKKITDVACPLTDAVYQQHLECIGNELNLVSRNLTERLSTFKVTKKTIGFSRAIPCVTTLENYYSTMDGLGTIEYLHKNKAVSNKPACLTFNFGNINIEIEMSPKTALPYAYKNLVDASTECEQFASVGVAPCEMKFKTTVRIFGFPTKELKILFEGILKNLSILKNLNSNVEYVNLDEDGLKWLGVLGNNACKVNAVSDALENVETETGIRDAVSNFNVERDLMEKHLLPSVSVHTRFVPE